MDNSRGSKASSTKRTQDPAPTKEPTQERIAQRAYEIYVQAGRRDGQALEDWLAAEQELKENSLRKDTQG